MRLAAELNETLNFAIKLLADKSAPTLQPVSRRPLNKDIANANEPINFGKSAKREVLSVRQAFSAARERNVFLKELKTGANGVIGALAAT